MTRTMNGQNTNDTRLQFVRAKGGDQHAFDALVSPIREKLLTWIAGRLGPRVKSKVEAEDVLQQTFVWALRSIEKLEWRGLDAFEQWLFSIAKHVILKEVARHNRQPQVLIECEPQGGGPSPSQALRRDERFRSASISSRWAQRRSPSGHRAGSNSRCSGQGDRDSNAAISRRHQPTSSESIEETQRNRRRHRELEPPRPSIGFQEGDA